MYSRWYNIAVVALWLTTMGWLFKQKVLPPLLVGDPPSFRTILQESDPDEPPVGWSIQLNGRYLGSATSHTVRHENGVSEILNHVRLSELPLDELTPVWLSSFLKVVDGTRGEPRLTLDVDAASSLLIDPLGRLASFQSKLAIGDAFMPLGPDPQSSITAFKIIMQGDVEGNQINLQVRSGEAIYATSAYLPPGALVGDIFSPQARLPNLKLGQTWTEPIYSPLRPPTMPMEVLYARVADEEVLEWNGRQIHTLTVVYRNDPGAGLTNAQSPRGRAWVTDDGLVLRQEVLLAASRLTFERLAPVDEHSDNLRGPPAGVTEAHD